MTQMAILGDLEYQSLTGLAFLSVFLLYLSLSLSRPYLGRAIWTLFYLDPIPEEVLSQMAILAV